jgi:hypothetical protein
LEPGGVSAVDSEGRTIWVVEAYGDDGKPFIERADEKLTAFTLQVTTTADGTGVGRPNYPLCLMTDALRVFLSSQVRNPRAIGKIRFQPICFL